jgi:hypothetical protein
MKRSLHCGDSPRSRAAEVLQQGPEPRNTRKEDQVGAIALISGCRRRRKESLNGFLVRGLPRVQILFRDSLRRLLQGVVENLAHSPAYIPRLPFRGLDGSFTLLYLTASLLSSGPLTSHAQLQLLYTNETQSVFAGSARRITLTWRNAGDTTLDLALRANLFQASSATAIPLGETPWKHLQILPGQTVIETARLSFPDVKAETRFIVEWLAGSNAVVGITQILVYPTNLLRELNTLAGEEPLGVLDPNNTLKPLLKALSVEFSDFEDAEMKNYVGKLAIVGPFQNKAQMRDGLANQIQALGRRGVGVVWIQPSPEPERNLPQPLKPSFYSVPEGTNAVVIVQPSLVSNLAENPQSQLNLIRLSELAQRPQPLRLPNLPAAERIESYER